MSMWVQSMWTSANYRITAWAGPYLNLSNSDLEGQEWRLNLKTVDSFVGSIGSVEVDWMILSMKRPAHRLHTHTQKKRFHQNNAARHKTGQNSAHSGDRAHHSFADKTPLIFWAWIHGYTGPPSVWIARGNKGETGSQTKRSLGLWGRGLCHMDIWVNPGRESRASSWQRIWDKGSKTMRQASKKIVTAGVIAI